MNLRANMRRIYPRRPRLRSFYIYLCRPIDYYDIANHLECQWRQLGCVNRCNSMNRRMRGINSICHVVPISSGILDGSWCLGTDASSADTTVFSTQVHKRSAKVCKEVGRGLHRSAQVCTSLQRSRPQFWVTMDLWIFWRSPIATNPRF